MTLTSKTLIGLLLLSLLLGIVVIWLIHDRANTLQAHARVTSMLQDSLTFHRTINEASFALLRGDAERSFALLALANAKDTMTNSAWMRLAQDYLQNRQVMQDSLTRAVETNLRHAQNLAQCKARSRQAELELHSTEQQQANLLDTYRHLAQKYEQNEQTRQELLQAINALKEENRHWQDSLAWLSKSVGSITFINRNGVAVDYFGYLKNGQANGYGIGFYQSGGIYRGQWSENSRNGYGKYLWKNGDYYEGEFEEGQRHGQGVYHFKSGEKFVGAWHKDQRNGYGEFFSADGKILLKGYWKNDKFEKNSDKGTKLTQ